MRTCLSIIVFAVACGDGESTYGDDLADPQVPPRGHVDVMTWITAGHYLAWSCESEPHPARPGSGHGRNRICSNSTLVSAVDGVGPFPVGAAAVKEIYESSGGIRMYAVYRKVSAGSGADSWYWYEGIGDEVIANAEGDGTCTGCHDRAPRDFVYTIVN